jgi:hypothetical protein
VSAVASQKSPSPQLSLTRPTGSARTSRKDGGAAEVLAGRHSLPGHGSSLAPATWALVDLSRSSCSPMLAPVPVATGSPPSAARSASCAAPPSHCFSLLRMPAMRRVYDVIRRHDLAAPIAA